MGKVLTALKRTLTKQPADVITEVIDERKQEIATVQVRDIKQYLVEEYERSRALVCQNEELQQELIDAEETRLKYDATLVTLDEYKTRLDSYEKKLHSKDIEIAIFKEQLSQTRDVLNDYKIKLSRASIAKDEIREEVAEEVKESIVKRIEAFRGSLSKSKMISLIRYGRE